MELSKEFMKEFVELQLCARVEKVEYDANLPLRDVEDEILRNPEISGVMLSIAVAKLLEKHGYIGEVISYVQNGKKYFTVVVNHKFVMDVERNNLCIHYDDAHYDDKVRLLANFYEDGLMTLKFFINGRRKKDFKLFGRPTKFTGTLRDFCLMPATITF